MPITYSSRWTLQCIDGVELEREESETHYWKLAWLHLYLVADLCSKHDPDHLPELAALLRRFGRMVCPPAVLHGMPDDLRKSVWRGTISPARATMQAKDIVAELDAHCQRYSELTLIKELRSSLLAQAYVSHESVRGRSVPNLTLVEPWHDDRLDHYWDGFVKFLLWPKPRRNARLVVRDANTLSANESLEHRLVLFYRGEENQLSVQVAPIDQGIYRGVVKGLPSSELVRLGTLSEVIEHENAVTFAGTKPSTVTRKPDEQRDG
jgi:hypothetical protein